MPAAIEVKNILKVFRTPSLLPWVKTKYTEALKGVSFFCPKEEISCLLGPNGAGKTSILKILAGLIIPDSGDALVSGMPLSKAPLSLRLKIGFATPNERSFYWRLTGRQNIDFFASLYGFNRKDIKSMVSEVMSEVGLTEEADKPYRHYSTGMKQRLLLARSLLGKPEILLLDEPTTHLDPLAQKTVHQLIREQFVEKRKTTVLFCTNNLTEATELADHLIFLNKGYVIAEGSLPELRSRLKTHIGIILEFTRLPRKGWEKDTRILGINREGQTIKVEISDEREIPVIINAAVLSGGMLKSCRQYEDPLTKIFTRVTEGERM